MIWKSFISDAQTSAEARDELRRAIQVEEGTLAVVFATSHHNTQFREIVQDIRDLGIRHVVGCSALSVIGEHRELENQPGVSVFVGSLPGTEIAVEHTILPTLSDGFLDDAAGVIVLADSFSSPTDALLRYIDQRAPDAAVFGGLASGGLYPGAHVLYDDLDVRNNGAVCIKLSGDVTIDTIVAQGCTPIGEPLIVTKHSENLILEFDKGRPVDVLTELLTKQGGRTANGLFVGLNLVDRPSGEYRPEDFLVRTFMGVDPNSGAITVGESVSEHQVVQFHVRDRDTSSHDVTEQLKRYAGEGHAPTGALLFTCIGRGRGLYKSDNHDVDALSRIVGDVPVGGFFCSGEIGRVGNRSFIHGYTSSFGFFRST